MDAVFPFGLSGPTIGYLVLYLFTLVIHVVFMNYVLAGSAYLAVSSIRKEIAGVGKGDESQTSRALCDWMPFALSAAITAGVAPLLFVQILYKRPFYTANLLLFHRWMSILPVLIIGFFLLYLLKARNLSMWPRGIRVLVGVGPFLCIAYTGYAWTENHVLSLREAEWPAFYAAGNMWFQAMELLPRFLLWAFGAIPTMCLLVVWQLRFLERRGQAVSVGDYARLARIALASLVCAAVCAVWYFAARTEGTSQSATASVYRPYAVLFGFGLILETWGWITIAGRGDTRPLSRWVITVGLMASIVGATVLRESIRIAAVDISAMRQLHEKAASVGGLPVFLGFFVINAVLIAWCFRIVRRGVKAPV